MLWVILPGNFSKFLGKPIFKNALKDPYFGFDEFRVEESWKWSFFFQSKNWGCKEEESALEDRVTRLGGAFIVAELEAQLQTAKAVSICSDLHSRLEAMEKQEANMEMWFSCY